MTNEMVKKRKKKGFTLIELMIVLAIMAILVAIAVPSFTAIRNNSRTTADQRSSASIARSVQTLVTDGTITHNGNFTFNNGAGTFDFATGFATASPAEQAAITTTLHDIDAPQNTANDGFRVTIAADGTVTCVAADI